MSEQLIKIVMPSVGDAEVIAQKGGEIWLRPLHYGGESMGPHILTVNADVIAGKAGESEVENEEVILRNRIKFKKDGRVELKKGDTADANPRTDV